jgi:hypothetical protein
MVQVTIEAEPEDFNLNVRLPGLSAIDEMVGRPPRTVRPGPKRNVIATREEDIPSKKFPAFWVDALDSMLDSYGRRCAFLNLYMERGTGNPSVDHMLPKSKRWDLVYEWTNYRLCAASINGYKSDMIGIVDPVDCRDGWFAVEFTGFQIVRGANAPPGMDAEIDATLKLLNHTEFRKAREDRFNYYIKDGLPLDLLERWAPFIASELRRQNRLRPGDS